VRFAFDDDQLAFRDGLRTFLGKEATPEAVRSSWDLPDGWSRERWASLAELGVVGCMLPEAHGGLGLDDTWFVLLLEEAGRFALPEPLAATAIAAAVLSEAATAEMAAQWLPRTARGEAVLTVRTSADSYAADADAADLVLAAEQGKVLALRGGHLQATAQPTVDRSRRLFAIHWEPASATELGATTDAPWQRAADRARLFEAAYLLGAAARLIELATSYATQREQFGVAIGSFQAVKHHLATALMHVEFARPLVYRAAWSVATSQQTATTDVAQAYRSMAEAARIAGRTSLQVHGAIGYTYEHDLHLWLNRALVPAYP